MEIILAAAIILCMYILIFLRLMVKHYYEKANNTKESAFAAIFSLPPHSKLCARGKVYSRRYWAALSVLLLMILILTQLKDFSHLLK